MKYLKRLKHVFLGNVGRCFSFFSRDIVLDTSSPFFEGLTDEEMKDIEGRAKGIYKSDSVRKWMRDVEESRKNLIYGSITKINCESDCITIHRPD